MGAQKLVNVVLSGLANEMQYIREQRDLTLEVVCDQLGWQQSKLSRMENGQQCISTADLASLLVIYSVQGKERQRLLHLVDRQDEPGYWEFDPPVDAESRPLARLEPEATALVDAETLMLPGLVQTADYTRAVMQAGRVPPEHVGSRVDARRARQFILSKDNPPKVDLIVHEAALRQVIGSPKIMATQLRVMLEAAERPNVRLWVVPFTLAGSVGFNTSFYLMNFVRSKSVLYHEDMTSHIYLEDEKKIEYSRRQAGGLADVALSATRSADFVARVAREYHRE